EFRRVLFRSGDRGHGVVPRERRRLLRQRPGPRGGRPPLQHASVRALAALKGAAMALEQTLNDQLTQAIKDKDTRTANVLRMLKTRLQERRTSKGFDGTV